MLLSFIEARGLNFWMAMQDKIMDATSRSSDLRRPLAHCLERFARKERHLLIREALGHTSDEQLPLSTAFRKKVAKALHCETIPPDAWWATDYHISWLAGAFAMYLDSVTKFPNPKDNKGRRLTERNQQDVDLVIAAGQRLILIEAKAYGYFSNDVMQSKIHRLNLLKRFYEQQQALSDRLPVKFDLILMAPKESAGLTTEWPDWATSSGRIPFIELPLHSDCLAVTQCSSDGKPLDDGPEWAIINA